MDHEQGPMVILSKTMGRLLNWAGNLEYSTQNLHTPETLEALVQLVRDLPGARPMGTRHSFNTIGDSRHHLISLERLPQQIEIDPAAGSVTVGAAVRYGDLATHLHARGFALHNLGSLPHITVGGACVSATHGSGLKNGILATAVMAMKIVDADGALISVSREKDSKIFDGCVVNLGALGVVTELTLKIHPTYDIKQDVFENLPLAALPPNLLSILSDGYSVSLFTDWQSDFVNQVWLKRKVEHGSAGDEDRPSTFFGAAAAVRNVHPIAIMSPENCTEQLGVPGPWHERLPHFRMDFIPSSGDELQSEYFVPITHAVDAVSAINAIRHKIAPHLLISELRTIDGDTLWMSPCYRRPSLAIHFTWKPDWGNVKQILPLIERSLSPYQVRTHWGKLFAMEPAQIRSGYEKLPAFVDLVGRFDPGQKFRNEFLDRILFHTGL